MDARSNAAKRQLELLPTLDEASKTTFKPAVSNLDQGKEAICVRQKYIQIVHHLDWGVVKWMSWLPIWPTKKAVKSLQGAEAKKRKAAPTARRKPRQEGALPKAAQ